MLSQLGWQKGETLGKGNQGLLTPVGCICIYEGSLTEATLVYLYIHTYIFIIAYLSFLIRIQINVVANEGTTGLGSTDTSAKNVARPMDKRKLANLKITQARYQRAKDIFVLSDESD